MHDDDHNQKFTVTYFIKQQEKNNIIIALRDNTAPISIPKNNKNRQPAMRLILFEINLTIVKVAIRNTIF